jgi:hypothetical protein
MEREADHNLAPIAGGGEVTSSSRPPGWPWPIMGFEVVTHDGRSLGIVADERGGQFRVHAPGREPLRFAPGDIEQVACGYVYLRYLSGEVDGR